eukprot:scaffold2884_cov65-Alexandrium_tamarense.AAC.1
MRASTRVVFPWSTWAMTAMLLFLGMRARTTQFQPIHVEDRQCITTPRKRSHHTNASFRVSTGMPVMQSDVPLRSTG